MLFLGNLLFAGVLGKSTENASLAALIQKNIAERVDPSFRAHKAEHVGISTRDLTARYLMQVVADQILTPDIPLKVVGIIKALIKGDKNLRWAWMGMLIFCPINYFFVIAWQLIIIFVTDFSSVSFLAYFGYEMTGGFMAVLMFLGMFYQTPGKIVLNYWLQWCVAVLVVGILGNLLGKFLPEVIIPCESTGSTAGAQGCGDTHANTRIKITASIVIFFMLLQACAYFVLIVLPLKSTIINLF